MPTAHANFPELGASLHWAHWAIRIPLEARELEGEDELRPLASPAWHIQHDAADVYGAEREVPWLSCLSQGPGPTSCGPAVCLAYHSSQK